MPTIPTDFAPATLNGADWTAVEPLIRALLTRPVTSRAQLEKWLLDRSELLASCAEAESVLYINMTCDTESKEAQDAYTSFIENFSPRLKPLVFELDRRQVELSREFPLASDRYLVLTRDTSAEVEIFREENVPLQTELDKLSQQYQQVIGSMMVTFDGQERTLPMMSAYQESTDRPTREKAWRLVAERRLKDAETIDGLYDQMVRQRHQVAVNAGFRDLIGYTFKSKRRFDYTPRHCADFHNACEKAVVPFMRRVDERRRKSLKIDSLRPWDLAVDPMGRAPLRPFAGGLDLVAKTRRLYQRMDPTLAALFESLGDGANTRGAANGACLDLDSRKGKAPGGYQAMRDRQRIPFIFMNAAGLQRDVETILHEAGHAFHAMLSIDEPLLHYRNPPIEFAEVASMSMELLSMPYWDSYYSNAEEAARARRQHLEGHAIGILPWIATIDAFQHWVYANPGHSRAERDVFWLSLDARFGHAVSWNGLEPARAKVWHRQAHLFIHPFYYIEYGIAQLGALQLWLRSVEEGEKVALAAYKSALALGGSRPLPELFKAAGLSFDFGESTVKRLTDRIERELEKLPE